MADITRDYDFSAYPPNTPIRGVEVDSEFDKLFAAINALDKENLSAALQQLLVQPGVIQATVGDTADPGFLLCDNSLVSQATYPALFARCGHKFNGGVDPGGGNFRLPDVRGRPLIGKGTHADVDTIGDADALAVGSRRPAGDTGNASPGTNNTGGHGHNVLTSAAVAGNNVIVADGGGGTLRLVTLDTHGHAGGTDTQGAHQHVVDAHSHTMPSTGHLVVQYQVKT